jgi:hypothetical protein
MVHALRKLLPLLLLLLPFVTRAQNIDIPTQTKKAFYSYSSSYTGATVDVRVNLCMTYLEGVGGGTCDATVEGGNQSIAGQINVGDGSHPIELLMPFQAQWVNAINDGVSCDLKQYGYTTISSNNPGGASSMFITNTGSNNPSSLYCQDTSVTKYVKISGVKFRNSGHTTASGVDFFWNNTVDNSSATDIDVLDIIGTTYATEVTNACCGMQFVRFNSNCSSVANCTPLYLHGGTLTTDFTCLDCSIDHPGTGLPQIKIDDPNHLTSVHFEHLYRETNTGTGDTSTTQGQIDGAQAVTVNGDTVYGGVASSANAAWSISNSYNTSFRVEGLRFTHDYVAFPVTGVINNNTTSCPSTPCNIPTDSSGTLEYTTKGNLVLVTSLTTTSAASDNVTMNGMTSSGHCQISPTNSSASTNYTTTYVSAKTTNQITVTHTATSGMTYDIYCTVN